MDERRDQHHPAGDVGLIYKAARLGTQEVTAEEMKAINKYALEPLEASDVFTFKAVLCDNELDRDFERFSLKALQDLRKLFLGKTVIKDHFHSADNQVARIYATDLVQSEKAGASGELYTQLVAHCYMVRTDSNKDLIAEIKGGIKKEGSVGCAVSSSICSICGTDNAKNYCRHWPGRSYEKDGGAQVCTFTLAGAKDAYEFSLVAVPAQRKAGVSKSYTGEKVYAPEEGAPIEEDTTEEETPADDTDKSRLLTLRARRAAAKNHKRINFKED